MSIQDEICPVNRRQRGERKKYLSIYAKPDEFCHYGRSYHGRYSWHLVHRLGVHSLVDVGCGFNDFCRDARAAGVNALGVDFACQGADVIAPAHSLPFPDRSFDLVTAFDVLEHLVPAEVELVLEEFSRVADSFIFSICYRPSLVLVDGQNLHPTVAPRSWWVSKISRHGSVRTEYFNVRNLIVYGNRYLWGHFRKNQPRCIGDGRE